MDDFYITIPSNDESFPNNTITEFRTMLPQTIDLRGQYECSLSEISFPKTWLNVIPDNKNNKYNTIKLSNIYGMIYCKIAAGFYESPRALFDEMKRGIINGYREKVVSWSRGFSLPADTIEKIKTEDVTAEVNSPRHKDKTPTVFFYSEQNFANAITFSYNSITKKVSINLNTDIIRIIHLSRVVQYILGFENDNIRDIENEAKYSCDMTAGLTTLFVYTDIISPQIIGSKYARILRTIPVGQKYEYGDRVDVIFATPHYVDVGYNNFSSIEINIRDHLGFKIDFNHGIVILKLHFRKKRLNIF